MIKLKKMFFFSLFCSWNQIKFKKKYIDLFVIFLAYTHKSKL